MSVAAAPRVLRATTGRMRIHVPGSEAHADALAARLRALPGVRSAVASAVTGNALVVYDPQRTDPERLLAAAAALAGAEPQPARERAEEEPPPATGPLLRLRGGRVRIAVRGLDRDAQFAARVVQRLSARPDVRRVVASQTTGRVLVELSQRVTSVQDILDEVSDLELPPLPGEDRPAHPLDPAPLIQSSARVAGAVAGLGMLAVRRALGLSGPPTSASGPAEVAAVAGILEGIPAVTRRARDALGEDGAHLLFSGVGVVSLTLCGAPLGLALAGASALRLLTEVRARRAAWKEYEERLEAAGCADPGTAVRLEAGDRVPLAGDVLSGAGTAIGPDGLPLDAEPGVRLPAGARVFGGPFVVALEGDRPFSPAPRPGAMPPTAVDRYLEVLGPLSLATAGVAAVATRSLRSAMTALLLINARPALIGQSAADTGASARVLRAGVTVVGTRPERVVRRPDVLLLDSPRALGDGFEPVRLVALDGADADRMRHVADTVATACGSPWGRALASADPVAAAEGSFEHGVATAEVAGRRYTLGPPGDALEQHPVVAGARVRGEHALVLDEESKPLSVVALRPRLAPGVDTLVAACARHGVRVAVLEGGDRRAARALAQRAGVELVLEADLVELVRDHQRRGGCVAVLTDGADDAQALDASDLGIGLTSGRSGQFPARADLLAPDLSAVAAIIEAGARRERAVVASVGLSVAANATGAVLGLRGAPGLTRASQATYLAALGAIGAGWALLRGGERSRSVAARLVDPRPERWGRQEPGAVLDAFGSSPRGLTPAEAARRARRHVTVRPPNPLVAATSEQLHSPLTAILAAGAGMSLALGAMADVAMIAAVIAANAVIGAWEEGQAGRAAEALQRMSAARATVVRDGRQHVVAAGDVVTGDILVVAAGDRIVADARLLEAQGLEVDEAALTGESLPVPKSADAGADAARVLLEGSDVTVGTGRAVVVAVGRGTRLGATAAALALDETRESPLGRRLQRLLRQGLPVIAAGGALVAVSGLLWGRPLLGQLAIGASIAIAAVPEGLPLMAGTAEAAVAQRLAGRRALVRRLAAVEALGRVDVACFDKTGTLTRGRLAVTRVAGLDAAVRFPSDLSPALRDVLLVAGLASPPPDAEDAGAHPTDVAVVAAAERAGLGTRLRRRRLRAAPFESSRAFHAADVGARIAVKGAAEALVPRCAAVRADGAGERSLDDRGRERLLDRAVELSGQGLRVLIVCEGPAGTDVDDPRELVALGFIGISDPLRPGVERAVRRCRDAGVRPVMLTGDHPATARAIGRDAGLLGRGEEVLTGQDVAALDDAELDRRLERAAVIARITPLDKVRIVESLQRSGHAVAMTGDGINDAPALRLADVGVAMGRGGTDVARQAADVVLADDDLRTLVEALVEGRAFWRNIRRALAMLLGGNLGELGLVAGASALGGAEALTTRQILAVNLVSDVLPAMAIAVQAPETRDLQALAREGTAALDQPLRAEVLRRGLATAGPSLAAYVAARGLRAQPETVAFAAIVSTQLAQTLQLGRDNGHTSRAVGGAVAASAATLVAALELPLLRGFLGLAAPGPAALVLIAAATAAAALAGGGRLPAAARSVAPLATPA